MNLYHLTILNATINQMQWKYVVKNHLHSNPIFCNERDRAMMNGFSRYYIRDIFPLFTDIDECASTPCQNGGECIDGVNSVTCKCAEYYTGPRCETGTYIIFQIMCARVCLACFVDCKLSILLISRGSYHITMTSYWPRWRLKSPALRLFTQPIIRAQIKENIKAPRHWPF